MELLLVYAAVFVCALIVFDWLLRKLVSSTTRSKSINRRLKLLEQSESNLDAYQKMVRERALKYDAAAFLPFLWARRRFAQSGLKIDTTRAAVYGLAGAVILWIVLEFLVASPALRILVFSFVVFGVPTVMVLRARSKRIQKFTAQLPGALDVVNRSLASGHPLPTAIALVARELPDPVGSEFGMLSDELTYGTDLDDAMLNMIERVGAEDLKLLAVSMSVQRGTGGNFVEILENLAKVLRDRSMLVAKVRALSAEGRITAIVMSAFPFLLYLLISTLSPAYFDPVWDSGYGPTVVTVGVCIMLVGNFILYKLVHFDF